MKNIILVVILVAVIGVWKFQDKIFNNEPASSTLETSAPKNVSPTTTSANTPVKIDLVISDRAFKDQLSQPSNFPKLVEELNSHFVMSGIEIMPSFSFYDDYASVPAEKYEGQIVITQATTLVNLIKDGKTFIPLYYVSPNEASCYKEIQVISLYESGIGSLKDIDGKRLILPGLKNPNSLSLKRFIEESGVNPMATILEEDRERYISKLTNKEADAAILYTGYLTSKDPVFSMSRFLFSSEYKYPCFVMYATNTMPTELLEKFKTVMNDLVRDPETNKTALRALGIKSFEPATTESFAYLTNDMKKYVLSEMRPYVAPPPPTPTEAASPMTGASQELPPQEDPKQLEMQQKLQQQEQQQLQQQQQIQQQMQQMQQMQQLIQQQQLQQQQQQLQQQQQQLQQKPADGSSPPL